jgi:hypothetical protein
MAVDPKLLMAVMNPDLFCANAEEVKKIISEGRLNKDDKFYLKAAAKAKLKEITAMQDFEEAAATGGAFEGHPVRAGPIEQHKLFLDSFNGSLEPIYFWILDYMTNYMGSGSTQPLKLIDTFVSSVGSGHFAEMQGRATRMQEEGMKMLGAANQVIKSVLNLVYDLKEFKMRLAIYDDLRSENKNTSASARLSLKQIWLDQVDIKRGNSSIKALAVSGANQPNFVTLIDAFMVVDNLDQLRKPINEGGIDLNERVKRILEQRVSEFNRWIEESERELRKRYEIEKSYLKSQVSTVKLYAKWAKPYLKAARQLEQSATERSNLVSSFNSLILQLVIMGCPAYSPRDDAIKGDLPIEYSSSDWIAKKGLRNYHRIVLVELYFRSIPERAAAQQGYGLRGRLEATFTSFGLSKEELDLFQQELDKDELGDLFKEIENSATSSLEQIQQEVDEFLKEDSPKKEKKKSSDDSNPFSALFSFLSKDESSDKTKAKPSSDKKKIDIFTPLRPDTDLESGLRTMALFQARINCRKVYDIYKKSHGLPSFPAPGG